MSRRIDYVSPFLLGVNGGLINSSSNSLPRSAPRRDPQDHVFFFKVAAVAASQATCERARCGSIIVSVTGEIIGAGWNAPPLDDESQRQCEVPVDTSVKMKNDKTCCVHAEWNAILDALKYDASYVQGATLYFMRLDDEGNFTQAGDPYCTVCSRLSLQAGIKYFGLWNDDKPQIIPTNEHNLLSYQYFQRLEGQK